MKELQNIIDGLEKTPGLLLDLLAGIPVGMLKERRIKNKWSIHEHTCHLPEAEKMILGRFEVFKNNEHPVFQPYLPGTTVSDDHLINMDLQESLRRFKTLRRSLLDLIGAFDEAVWTREGAHPEYNVYNAYILLRHTLMHDHFHMYRIEELWLTKDELLRAGSL